MINPWQQTQWQHIKQLIEAERLPHAMLLVGNHGLGKADFALTMAHTLLCLQPTADNQACGSCKSCLLLAAETHPDLYRLKPTALPKSKSKKPALNIRIDDIRDLCNSLNQTSQYGGYRVAIIDQADQLTISAANSLLKTLEEPGRDILIVLITSRAHRLPVTIRSRSQLLRFTEPEEKLALDWLQENQPAEQATPRQLQQALKYAHGSPLAALLQLQDDERHQVLGEAMTAAISGKNTLDYAEKLAKFTKVQILESMISWVSDLSRLLSCGPETALINDSHRIKLQQMAKKVNQQRLFRFHDQLNFNLLHSSIAVNEQLLWENLLLSWDNL